MTASPDLNRSGAADEVLHLDALLVVSLNDDGSELFCCVCGQKYLAHNEVVRFEGCATVRYAEVATRRGMRVALNPAAEVAPAVRTKFANSCQNREVQRCAE